MRERIKKRMRKRAMREIFTEYMRENREKERKLERNRAHILKWLYAQFNEKDPKEHIKQSQKN